MDEHNKNAQAPEENDVAPAGRLSPREPGYGNENDEAAIDFRKIIAVFWRRKALIFGIFLIMISLAVIYLSQVEARYQAKALILIESISFSQPELEALLQNASIDTSLVLSEVEIIKSRIMARKVIERLNLTEDPEFNPFTAAVKKNTPDVAEPARQTTKFKTFSIEQFNEMPIEVTDLSMSATVDNFLRRLTVKPVTGSYVIQIFFESHDRRKAALITNTVADLYIAQSLIEKNETSQKVTRWLDMRLDTLREQVQLSEAAVEEYRSRYGLLKGVRAELTVQQITELSSQLILAKSRLAEAQARMANIKGWQKNPSKIEAAPESLNSQIIRELRMLEADLAREIAEQSGRYGEKHPTRIALEAQMEDVGEKIKSELQRIGRGIEAEMAVAQARVNALEASIDELEERQGMENRAMIRLRALEREAESSREILNAFLETYKRSDEKEQLQEAEAKVVSYASIPVFPSYPNKSLILVMTVIVSLMLGVVISLLLEKLDNAFRSALHLEKATGFPCYGLIPEVDGRNEKDISDYILEKPTSSLAEALRGALMAIKLRTGKRKPKVITVTSSFPGEGKTTLASWIAKSAAKSGDKVIVIDCDLRRPRLHYTFAKENKLSLVEYLTGQNEIEEVIYKDPQSGVDAVFGRSIPGSALDLLNTSKMQELIETLRSRYDLVVIDSPACLAVADSKILATYADFTLYAIYWNSTPREVVATGIKQFSDFGYDRLGFVLTNVNVRKHIQYGYGDTAYYYSRYREYYKD